MKRKNKYISVIMIDNMKCSKHYITLSAFPKLGFVKEEQGFVSLIKIK